ncbi:small VCP/p97-interacting protein [Lethenteron reissneri]|uniref:small VCP/p97-interacting protein n=1 Tax=Lethenteron reissneri TaxID=7753 RepID=UPI002AB7BE4D|nr:small VCP/p97-interacting protein [Lethenteron reissneri]
MGSLCFPCLGGQNGDQEDTQDLELRRAQLAAAAEKRIQESSARGIKDPEGVARKKKQREEMERKLAEEARSPGEGGGLAGESAMKTLSR